VRLSLTVKREAKGQGSERVQIVRPKTGFSAYITPPTPTGMPDGVLYPTQATEHTTVEMPVVQHFIDAIDLELGRATGDILAVNVNGNIQIKVPGGRVLEQARHRVHVKVPGRGQQIALQTTNGNIHVR